MQVSDRSGGLPVPPVCRLIPFLAGDARFREALTSQPTFLGAAALTGASLHPLSSRDQQFSPVCSPSLCRPVITK